MSEWPGQPAPPVAAGAYAVPAAGPMVLADYGPRVLAAIVDFLIRAAIVFVPMVIGAMIDDAADIYDDTYLTVGAVIGLVVGSVVYAPLLMGMRNGQTWGHSAAGIRVVRLDGSEIGTGKAFVREVLVKAVLWEGLGFFLFGVPALVNYLWPLGDSRNQALHDKMCDTLVVKA